MVCGGVVVCGDESPMCVVPQWWWWMADECVVNAGTEANLRRDLLPAQQSLLWTSQLPSTPCVYCLSGLSGVVVLSGAYLCGL